MLLVLFSKHREGANLYETLVQLTRFMRQGHHSGLGAKCYFERSSTRAHTPCHPQR